ncbi:hypothetical protein EV360DRAFT_77098, partial [Lentinula raphanica]
MELTLLGDEGLDLAKGCVPRSFGSIVHSRGYEFLRGGSLQRIGPIQKAVEEVSEKMRPTWKTSELVQVWEDRTPLSRRGRAIPKLVTVYEDIHTLLAQYDEYREERYHQAEADDEEDNDLEKGAKSARSFDTSKVMSFVGEELNKEVQRKINQTRQDNRGLQNDITGLLCPVEFDWDDPVDCAAVRAFNSDYNFAASPRPRCFYKEEMYDANDPDNGYLQSYLLVQKKKTGASYRSNVAQIIHMDEVKPRSIAYAAIHLHFALTDAPHWNPGYHGFNYLDLWNFIVDFFEDPGDDEEEKRSKELLEWWN